MPRVKKGEWPLGNITCKWCSAKFIALVSTRFCSKECKKLHNKKHNKLPRKERPETKRTRRLLYREAHRDLGLCRDCNRIIYRGGRCEKHFLVHKRSDRIRKAKKDYGQHWRQHVELLIINDITEEIYNETEKIISKSA